ncbi:MAG: flavodoxin domain-containing protein [Micrococcus sp.]|nr:flavodoxin domain-containing protein [Micrococcus sp.]
MTILVGYASAHGSTEEISRRIAGILQEQGGEVEVAAVEDVTDPAVFDAIVLGSAIHHQAWLPRASEFVHGHQDVLRDRPVWLFSVGMSGGLPRWLRPSARAAQDRRIARALRDVVRPRGHHLFSGAASAEAFPRSSVLLMRVTGIRLGDYRDWAEVEAWASGIARELRGLGYIG